MRHKNNLKKLRFYFITDYEMFDTFPVYKQVSTAIKYGATTVQYRNKKFTVEDYDNVAKIRYLCNKKRVIFIINDNILLAKAVNADGVHLGQNDEKITLARKLLGSNAILGLSVSNLIELKKTSLNICDYIGAGPIFETKTKLDAEAPQGLTMLSKVVLNSSKPAIAIGGIKATNAEKCFEKGAYGVAVISYITRNINPIEATKKLASICFS